MRYDRRINISTAGSRKATRWAANALMWSEMVARLATPNRGAETLEQYLELSRARQDELKDVGGFVAGGLRGGRRKANAVLGRDVITLDLDNIPPGGVDEVLRRVAGLGVAYCVYSTRKHSPDAPRIRVLVLLNRTASADEYEPIARKLASMIRMEWCDPTTFEASRLMYWPSCCADSAYVYQYADAPMLDADGMLALYKDWRDAAEWPEVPGQPQQRANKAKQQGDPVAKAGTVGAFCRIYDIISAMDEFLPGVYESTDTPGRYTFTGGSTTGGAVLYDDGKFLYSHHSTDPCSNRLVNAFDLVRLHRFGDQDDDAMPGTPTNRLPSYTAMCELANQDTQVRALIDDARYKEATSEFQAIVDALPSETLPQGLEDPQTAVQDTSWLQHIKRSPSTGQALKTITNARLVLENDPLLRGRISMDLFADRVKGLAPLPWGTRLKTSGSFDWTDNDNAGLREHIERVLGFRTAEVINDALLNHAALHGYNPVIDYLCAQQWDGVPRLDTLYIDYLGADDHPYTRAVTRKGFAAAVARAMAPGIKFDTMTVIDGKQGIGKSTLFHKLGLVWFNDCVRTFDGKEGAELLQGSWIIEIGELSALDRTDSKEVKLFLSKTDDIYRKAYGHLVERLPRRCVFFGTTNDYDYLRDPTGNRRFWPISAQQQPATKSVFTDLAEDTVGQIWAEAVVRWRVGEPLYLDPDLEQEAERRRSNHMERDTLQGQIEEFLSRPVPEDWQSWALDRRRMFWSGGAREALKLTPRDRVCALEIWRECLGDTRSSMSKGDAARINTVLDGTPGWERVSTMRFGPGYGTQRGYRRAEAVNILANNPVNTCKLVNILPMEDVNDVNRQKR